MEFGVKGSSAREGLVWVGLRGEREKEIDERSSLYESRGCESRRDGRLFEVMQVDVVKSKVLML